MARKNVTQNPQQSADTGMPAHEGSHATPRHPVLELQRTIGNQAVGRMMEGGGRTPGASESLEHAADATAERALASPAGKGPDANPGGGGGSPPNATGSTGGEGGGLSSGTRAFFEGRFGTSFDDVQVHTGEDAARAAETLNANAFTAGNHIAFARGKYMPETTEGRRLIAHELAHVVQQRSGAAAGIQREDKDTPAAPAGAPLWYQRVLDDLDEDRKRVLPLHQDYLIPLRDLCIAVDAGKTAEIPKLVDKWIAETSPGPLAHEYAGMAVAGELYSRLVFLGLDPQADKIREYSHSHYLLGLYNDPPIRKIDYGLFKKATDDLIAKADLTDPAAARGSIDRMLSFYKEIQAELRALDPAVVESEMEWKALRSPGDSGLGFRMSYDEMGQLEFYESARALLGALSVAIWRSFQVIEDKAVSEVAASGTSTTLADARSALDAIGATIYLTDIPLLEKKTDLMASIRGETATVTTSDFTAQKHSDYFGSTASVKFTYYSDDPARRPRKEGQAMQWDVFRYHLEQIEFLERLHGKVPEGAMLKEGKTQAEVDEAKKEAVRDQGVVTAMGGLDIHGSDSMRTFVAKKFESETTAGRSSAEAFESVVRFIERYFYAFTFHTPFNIEEFGDNYLNKTFPRALTGQLIHDCGVYALRIIYMLSLLRADHPELDVKIRYIRMPAHVGLVITGTGLPIYFAHNDTLKRLEPSQIDSAATSAADISDATLADFATGFFIPKTSMPYRMAEVPLQTGSTPSKLRTNYFTFYKEKMVTDVVGADKAEPEFHLRYLQLMDKHKELFNTEVRAFWNVAAPAVWRASGANLTAALSAFQADNSAKKAELRGAYMTLRDAYVTSLGELFGEKVGANKFEGGIRAGLTGIEGERQGISQTLDDHKKLVASGAKRAHAENVNINYGWLIDVMDYINLLKDDTKIDALTPKDLEPPWLNNPMAPMK